MIRELHQLRRAQLKRGVCLIVTLLCVVANTLWVFSIWMKYDMIPFTDALMGFAHEAPYGAPLALLSFFASLYYSWKCQRIEAQLYEGRDDRER